MSKTKLWLVVAGGVAALIASAVYFTVPRQSEQVAAPQEISAAPVFAASFRDLDDQLQPLKRWHGKVVVRIFWAPWCPPCREEIPDFISLQDKHRERGLVFIGVALDE